MSEVPQPVEAPICPTCGQPGSALLAGTEGYECRNEACPEFGQPLRPDEPGPPLDSAA